MPVRLKITLVFSLLVFFILGLMCAGIYYFFYTARVDSIKNRLTNRAITTGRLLSQRETFDQKLVQQIDSLTTISLKNIAVQAYDENNRKIYAYSDLPDDSITINSELIEDARVNDRVVFGPGNKEAIAYYYTGNNARIVIAVAAEDTDGQQNLYSLRKILLLSFLFGNVIVLVTGYFFSRGLLKPVRKITAEVAEISAQNLERRLDTGETRDEWFQLSATLNAVLNRLQQSFALQRRFISHASHELSTPLTSISSQLEVSLQRVRDAQSYREVMQSIYQDVQHMTKLTQTLLEFAKASGDPGGLEIIPVRIDEILLKLPAEIARLDPSYHVNIHFGELPDEEQPLLVFGNEALLTTAIRNIIVNGCKYSPDHSARLSLKISVGSILITVEDHGRGISQADIAFIFQPFYRAPDLPSQGGFGLGLSLAERIIKLHHGSLSVASEVGKGTSFVIQLPSSRMNSNSSAALI